MLARTIICLLALACIMAGVEGKSQESILPEIASGRLVSTLDLFFTESIGVIMTYPGSNESYSTSNLTLDPGKEYMIFVVEIMPRD